MKRTILFIVALMTIGYGWAQSLNKNEAKALQTYLSESAAKGGNNAEALGMTGNNYAVVPGVKVENGYVTEIDWSGKNIAGALNLSGFKYLKKVDVTGNKITAVTLKNNPAMVEFNGGNNRIADITITGCPQMQYLRLNRNRLAEFDFSEVPMVKKVNISGNMIEVLDVANAVNLEYLNCMSNAIKQFTVTGCQNLKSIYAGFNDITAVELAGLVKLENLNINSNKLAKVYIQDLPALETLLCSDNHMQQLVVKGCTNINEIWAPYNDLTVFEVSSDSQALAFVNVEWNDLTRLTLANMNFLQRVNAANNQLITLDLSFDPMLRFVNVTNNDMLTDVRFQGDSQLRHVIGYDWNYGF